MDEWFKPPITGSRRMIGGFEGMRQKNSIRSQAGPIRYKRYGVGDLIGRSHVVDERTEERDGTIYRVLVLESQGWDDVIEEDE
jgi:hypothetical protein